jgi:toxin ParE1/3/4
MATYKLSLEAEDDLNVVWIFGLERFGEAQADKFYYDILSHCQNIADNPKQYPAVDEIRTGYRRCVFSNHSIFYREKDGFIEVTRIYGKQDPNKI